MYILQTHFHFTIRDIELDDLLNTRQQQTQNFSDITLIIADKNDSIEDINTALGFHILTNHWTGQDFRNSDFQPSWEYMENHINWVEVAYLYNDERGALLFIQKPLHPSLEKLFSI